MTSTNLNTNVITFDQFRFNNELFTRYNFEDLTILRDELGYYNITQLINKFNRRYSDWYWGFHGLQLMDTVCEKYNLRNEPLHYYCINNTPESVYTVDKARIYVAYKRKINYSPEVYGYYFHPELTINVMSWICNSYTACLIMMIELIEDGSVHRYHSLQSQLNILIIDEDKEWVDENVNRFIKRCKRITRERLRMDHKDF